jgi:hypothetical protein
VPKADRFKSVKLRARGIYVEYRVMAQFTGTQGKELLKCITVVEPLSDTVLHGVSDDMANRSVR